MDDDVDDGGKVEVDHRDGDGDGVEVVVEAHDVTSNDVVVVEPEEYSDAPWVPNMARRWSQGRHL